MISLSVCDLEVPSQNEHFLELLPFKMKGEQKVEDSASGGP